MLEHLGHELELVTYGLPGEAPVNVSLECLSCGEVLEDHELPDQDDEPESGSVLGVHLAALDTPRPSV